MKISTKGLALIAKFEGLRLEAYLCPAKVPTIGYGNTYYEDGVKVKLGDKITKERAEELLKKLVVKYEDAVHKAIKTAMTQNQFDALVSLCWNIGATNLMNSSVAKSINKQASFAEISVNWKKWNKGGGKILPGLVKRRIAELNLYGQ